jgi:hypothetical protein
MRFLTSIPPSHPSDLQRSVGSWAAHGEVYSLNVAHEIPLLKDRFPYVTFVSTERVDEKKRVSISAFIDFAKKLSDGTNVLINADIVLDAPAEVFQKYERASERGVVVCQRLDFDWEHKGGRVNPKAFEPGFDVFMLHTKFLDVYPQSRFFMGKTHWDYWIPWHAQRQGVDVYRVTEPFAYHKKHKQQFSNESWREMGCWFRFMYPELTRFHTSVRGIGELSEYIRTDFMSKLKTYEEDDKNNGTGDSGDRERQPHLQVGDGGQEAGPRPEHAAPGAEAHQGG